MGHSISTSGAGSRRRRTASGGQCDLHHAPGHRPSSASSPFLAATALCLSGLFACARGEKNKVRQQWGTSSSGGPGSEVGLPSPATVSVRRRCEGTAMDAVGPFTLAMENRVRSEYRSSSAMEDVKHASEAAAAANTNRRALRDVKNIIGAPHRHHHLAVTKRGLHEKPSAADAKNQPGGFAGHRPVTRKFAAALATQPANAPLV